MVQNYSRSFMSCHDTNKHLQLKKEKVCRYHNPKPIHVADLLQDCRKKAKLGHWMQGNSKKERIKLWNIFRSKRASTLS